MRAGEGAGSPIVLVHGWPGAVLEFERLIPLLVECGHEVIAPSLPGYGFSDAPETPLNAARVAARLRELVEDGLGIECYAVQGGDWGNLIATRMAYDSPERVTALHINSPSVLPFPADLSDLTDAEQAWLAEAAKWRTRGAYYMLTQGAAPDTLAPALNDSPAGLAAWLVSKYRDWSDCGGDVETRFTLDQLCDFLTRVLGDGHDLELDPPVRGRGPRPLEARRGGEDRRSGRRRRLPAGDPPPTARVGRADARRPAPVDRARPRRPLRRLGGARAPGP